MSGTAIYTGDEVSERHACRLLRQWWILGVAAVLAAVRERLPGTVIFIFQRAGGYIQCPQAGNFAAPLPYTLSQLPSCSSSLTIPRWLCSSGVISADQANEAY
jgi:hypothetical protein